MGKASSLTAVPARSERRGLSAWRQQVGKSLLSDGSPVPFGAQIAVTVEATTREKPPHGRQSRLVQSADGRLGGGFSQIIASVEAAVCARSLADNIQPVCPGQLAENEDLRRLKLFFGGRLGLLQLISNRYEIPAAPEVFP